ncbi:Arm DNA-binding domain-containing protein [Bordetella ansorpii]|uniref:Arm DNA-binding domain-containing protein n=1 Tax=Bordetella ansorpii TaxID=288768 RepID=UPI001E52C9C1|nr:Arm DNA-binding domain-containing protein [Bordetella ansorpii]
MLADGDGLYLRVRATGKSWVYRYKLEGKTTKLGLGPYPAISLAAARQKAQAQLQKRAEGIDPKEARRDEQRIPQPDHRAGATPAPLH